MQFSSVATPAGQNDTAGLRQIFEQVGAVSKHPAYEIAVQTEAISKRRARSLYRCEVFQILFPTQKQHRLCTFRLEHLFDLHIRTQVRGALAIHAPVEEKVR